MPIKFVSLNEKFIDIIKTYGFESHVMRIQDYEIDQNKRTYYVSPANSLCFMDGGIDYALSRVVFPNIEKQVKGIVRDIGITSLVGKPYLPIGSSIIVDADDKISLVVAPTMLLPQNVTTTDNGYYATMAVLHNVLVNRGERLEDVVILLTSFCCGYGKMSEENSVEQMLKGIRDYKNYKPTASNPFIIINEPTLDQQPKYYQNTEFFKIEPKDLVYC